MSIETKLLYVFWKKEMLRRASGTLLGSVRTRQYKSRCLLLIFQVRIWEIGEKTQKLGEVLKEHKSAVSCIKMKKDNRECVTASLDGSCIIWDIV